MVDLCWSNSEIGICIVRNVGLHGRWRGKNGMREAAKQRRWVRRDGKRADSREGDANAEHVTVNK